jgi:hypothetical protein
MKIQREYADRGSAFLPATYHIILKTGAASVPVAISNVLPLVGGIIVSLFRSSRPHT